MSISEQSIKQIESALLQLKKHFHAEIENPVLTDIYMHVRRESGEFISYDDNDNELFQVVVEEWATSNGTIEYSDIAETLVTCIEHLRQEMESLNILRPYSFVLQDEDQNILQELYLVDDENVIVSDVLMEGLEEDLNSFWEELSKKL